MTRPLVDSEAMPIARSNSKAVTPDGSVPNSRASHRSVATRWKSRVDRSGRQERHATVNDDRTASAYSWPTKPKCSCRRDEFGARGVDEIDRLRKKRCEIGGAHAAPVVACERLDERL